MKIEISENGIIFCDRTICDPVAMYDSCAECGGCPFVSLFNRYLDIWLEGGC